MRTLSLLLFLLFSTLFGVEIADFDADVYNGETGVVAIQNSKEYRCDFVKMGAKKFPFVSMQNNKSVAFFPISYYAKEKQRELQLLCHNTKGDFTHTLHVKSLKKDYPSEEIHVNKSLVNPRSKEVQKRIAAEYKEAMKIYNKTTPKLYITKPFILPLKESVVTSDFGKARLYNNTLKGYHSGTDFRSKKGTPVFASNDGEVVLVKERFYSGKSVVIDHGAGIYTCYFHLSEPKVRVGEFVHRGETVGLSGATGRVTGPHLHFSVRIGGVVVNPLHFTQLANKYLYKEKN